MINWVLQLNNRQCENSFNSVLEKHHVLSFPNQSKPNPICNRSGKPEVTERVFVETGKTSRSQEIDDKRLHEEFGSSDRTGKPVKSEDIRVMHAHDGTSTHTQIHTQCKNLVLPDIVILHHQTRTNQLCNP